MTELLLYCSYCALFREGVGGVGFEDPGAGGADGVFVFKPEEAEVVDALGEVGFDDDVARDHASGDEGEIGTVVTVASQFRDGSDGGDVGRARDRVRTEKVVGGTQRVFGPDDVGECFVKEVHAGAEFRDLGGASPCAEAGRDAEGGLSLIHI